MGQWHLGVIIHPLWKSRGSTGTHWGKLPSPQNAICLAAVVWLSFVHVFNCCSATIASAAGSVALAIGAASYFPDSPNLIPHHPIREWILQVTPSSWHLRKATPGCRFPKPMTAVVYDSRCRYLTKCLHDRKCHRCTGQEARQFLKSQKSPLVMEERIQHGQSEKKKSWSLCLQIGALASCVYNHFIYQKAKTLEKI